MMENLKTTKYNDGTPIPNVTIEDDWFELETGAQCDYDNNPENSVLYGKLYNWHAVNTGKLCPKGWHVPTLAEWETLEKYLIANGYNFDGTTSDNKIAKSLASTTGWTSSENAGSAGNNQKTNNKTGFTGLPCGIRDNYGEFRGMATNTQWWISSIYLNYSGYCEYLNYSENGSGRYFASTEFGNSVRCVKD
jgi:uncharacterized protein (TIGR02145 family)